MIGQDVLDDRQVHVCVAMHEDVPEPGHVRDAIGEVPREPACPRQTVEQVAVRRRLAQALFRDDVRSHVERGLDAELKRMLNEPLLSDIGFDFAGPSLCRDLPRSPR